MLDYDQDKVYNGIANAILDSVDDDWASARLEIEIDSGFFSFYCIKINKDSIENPVRFIKEDNFSDSIKWLHTFTSSIGNTKWNRAHFTMDNSGKFDMQFIWDQETQDKVDAINKTRK